MQNQLNQTILWALEAVGSLLTSPQFKTTVAITMGAYLSWVLFNRFRTGEDPSIRYQKESGGGSMSLLLSGVHVTLVLAGIIAAVTWPLVAENATAAVLLGGAVVVHYALEKREVSMN